MKKQTIIEHFGGATKTARALRYAHRNVVYGWGDILTPRIYADIIGRMRAYRIAIPKGWDKP